MIEAKRDIRWRLLSDATMACDEPGIAVITTPADSFPPTSNLGRLKFRIDGSLFPTVLSAERRVDPVDHRPLIIFRVVTDRGIAIPPVGDDRKHALSL